MPDADTSTPRIYGTPDSDRGADRSTPATGFQGEEKAVSGAGYEREAIVDDDHTIIVEEMSGVAAAEAGNLHRDPSSG